MTSAPEEKAYNLNLKTNPPHAPRSPLRPPFAAQDPRLHDRGFVHARPRHRREHRDLLRRARDPAAPAGLSRAGPDHGADGNAPAAIPRLSGFRGQLPRLAEPTEVFRKNRRHAEYFPQLFGWHPPATPECPAGHAELLRGLRDAAVLRGRLLHRGGGRERRQRGRAKLQLWPLAKFARRRHQCPRGPPAPARWRGLHGSWASCRPPFNRAVGSSSGCRWPSPTPSVRTTSVAFTSSRSSAG